MRTAYLKSGFVVATTSNAVSSDKLPYFADDVFTDSSDMYSFGIGDKITAVDGVVTITKAIVIPTAKLSRLFSQSEWTNIISNTAGSDSRSGIMFIYHDTSITKINLISEQFQGYLSGLVSESIITSDRAAIIASGAYVR